MAPGVGTESQEIGALVNSRDLGKAIRGAVVCIRCEVVANRGRLHFDPSVLVREESGVIKRKLHRRW